MGGLGDGSCSVLEASLLRLWREACRRGDEGGRGMMEGVRKDGGRGMFIDA